nr:hypothetical protein [Tanacetum cinerariifolium]
MDAVGDSSKESVVNVGADLGAKVRNIDGKIVGKDGKPLRSALRKTFMKQVQPNTEKGESVFMKENSSSGVSSHGIKQSFVDMFKKSSSTKAVRLQKMTSEVVQGANVAIPIEVVEEVSKRFDNTLYGYFIGQRLAFPLVENYVKHAWAKFGLERLMLTDGFFFFQFATREGMKRVLEEGSWMIRLVPIFLNIWTPNTLGRPIMLDSYTSTMCQQSWGENTYARALMEVSSLTTLKESLVVAIPLPNKEGHTLVNVDVEYEWQPPYCETCQIFDHWNDDRPKKEKVVVETTSAADDGFIQVKRKKGKAKIDVRPKQPVGIEFNQPKKQVYREVKKPSSGEASTSSVPAQVAQQKVSPLKLQVPIQNAFESLMEYDMDPDGENPPVNMRESLHSVEVCDDDDDEVEEVFAKKNPYEHVTKGASTPSDLLIRGYMSYAPKCLKVGSGVPMGKYVQRARVLFSDGTQKWSCCAKVYAHNRYIHRRNLWQNLVVHSHYVRGRPWCIMGDFNVALSANDKSMGLSMVDTGMKDFQDCVETVGVTDVNCTGLRFTWTQKPRGGDGILKKIDRIMENFEFYSCFVGANAVFQPYRISDHGLAVLRIPRVSMNKPRPFKFFNFLVLDSRFKEIVDAGWNVPVSGFWMYKVVKRLKGLKKPLRKLLFDHGNINDNVKNLCVVLDAVQIALDLDPSNVDLREEAAACDANTSYFHKVVKSKAARNRIDSVLDASGNTVAGEQVGMAFVDYYSYFLGQSGSTIPLEADDLFTNMISEMKATYMVRDVSDNEIRDAMFAMCDNKAPGPDGFSAAFFKGVWDIISDDIFRAVKEFFTNG